MSSVVLVPPAAEIVFICPGSKVKVISTARSTAKTLFNLPNFTILLSSIIKFRLFKGRKGIYKNELLSLEAHTDNL
jgi:hypothetical protein